MTTAAATHEAVSREALALAEAVEVLYGRVAALRSLFGAAALGRLGADPTGIASRRLALGLSQRQLSRRCSVSRSQLSALECGDRLSPAVARHVRAVLDALEGAREEARA